MRRRQNVVPPNPDVSTVTPADQVPEADLIAAAAALGSRSEPRLIATRWTKRIFIAGLALGALGAWLVVKEQDIKDFGSALDLPDLSSSFDSIDLATWFDSAGISGFAESLNLSPAREWLLRSKTSEFEVGLKVVARNQTKKHAVILIPGIISSGLESWSTTPGTLPNFRKRIWGSTSMLKAIIQDRTEWLKAMALDPVTGLDPPGGYKIRAVPGLAAATSFMPGYWLWAKIIENLAVIDYTTDLSMASYDWRLAYSNLEERDQYFSRLKLEIELNLVARKQKTVLVAHSMGSLVVLYFMKWVEAEGYGNGGDQWCETHIESFVNIAGTLLGVPKAMSALLSGEMRDTVELNPAAIFLLEKFFSKHERAKLFRSWAGASSMILKGGNAVWGDEHSAPDDPPNAALSGGAIFRFKPTLDITTESAPKNLTLDDANSFIMSHSPSSFSDMLRGNFSYGMERDEKVLDRAGETSWTNPLETRLPLAPSMKIYCLYGYGKPTERSYFYHSDTEEAVDEQCSDSGPANLTTCNTMGDVIQRKSSIDGSVNLDVSPKVSSGVVYGEGDGTVALLSLGAMCVDGWKRDRYNPGRIPVVTHELLHDPVLLDIRGGPRTADHVDILLSSELNEAILDIVSGHGDRVQDQFFSRIKDYAAKIKWD